MFMYIRLYICTHIDIYVCVCARARESVCVFVHVMLLNTAILLSSRPTFKYNFLLLIAN